MSKKKQKTNKQINKPQSAQYQNLTHLPTPKKHNIWQTGNTSLQQVYSSEFNIL